MRLISFIIIIGFFLFSCREKLIEPENTNGFGTLIVDSNPQNATILLNGNITGRFTPSEFANLLPGLYPVSLMLNGYKDTTLYVEIFSGNTRSLNIKLNSDN